MRRESKLVAALVALVALWSTVAGADGILVNARIYTFDVPRSEADALVWDDGGRIVAVGTADTLRAAHPEARVVDAAGATVLPGLIDAHGHVLGLGLSLQRVGLRGTRSIEEVIDRLRAAAAALPRDAWLIGRGWDQNDWADAAFPTRAVIDRAFPDRPVFLERVDGHAAWVNGAALARATRSLDGDWQPDGGRIVREDGKPTGILVDTAMALVESAIPLPDATLKRRAYRLAFAQLLAHGITGVHDAGVNREDLAVLRSLADAGELPVRIYAMADGDGPAFADLCARGPYTHASGRLEMRTVKLYLDGALGSRGAALLADYDDDPGNRGLVLTEPDAFGKILDKAKKCKLQVAAHAIGDRANRIALDGYAAVIGKDGGDLRWRVEHVQVVDPADIPRFAQLRVIASMQPTHATSDMPWAKQRVGERRLAGAYAWRSLLDAGARIAFGSDFPVEQVDPLLGIYAAVARQDMAGNPPGGWLPGQRVDAAEAIAGFTVDAAYAQFAERTLGTLTVGKRADFVLLDRDVLEIEPARIPGTRVIATYVDGRRAFP